MLIIAAGAFMKSNKELLGARIRELRKGLKMSQEQLSELVDVDPRYISRIELGKEKERGQASKITRSETKSTSWKPDPITSP